MKKQMKISDLCSHLHAELYQDMEPAVGAPGPTAQQIQQAVAARLHPEQAPAFQKEYTMKKKPTKIIVVAAIICLFGATAIAATGGLDYFKSLFGNTAPIEQSIWSPQVTASNEDYQLTVESMLSDGYKTDAIVSLTRLGKKPLPQTDEMSGVDYLLGGYTQTEAYSSSADPMPEFDKEDKSFYHLEIAGMNQTQAGDELYIQLKNDGEPLQVQAPLQGTLAGKEITPNHKVDDSYTVERVQLSPLGVLVEGNETNPKGGLATAQIDVKMKDGTTEELISSMSFDSGPDDDTVIGGGGMIIGGSDDVVLPLVTSTAGERNPGGKIITRGSFSRALNLNDAVAIVIDGVEYPLP